MKRLPIILIVLFACAGEDIVMDEVNPEVRITNAITNMQINTSWQFEYMALNNVGIEVTPDELSWSTSDADIVLINQSGEATALDNGEVDITLRAVINGAEVDTTITFEVNDNETTVTQEVRTGKIMTTTSYALVGDFEITADGDDLLITFASNYVADDNLPGLYVYLTNNPNSPTGGYEIGPVQVFSGAHDYTIPDTDLFDYDYLFYYCKPFKVKVGHGDIE